MPAITEGSVNNKSLSNASDNGDILVDQASMIVNDANQPVNSLGRPITKTSVNNKSLTNDPENT